MVRKVVCSRADYVLLICQKLPDPLSADPKRTSVPFTRSLTRPSDFPWGKELHILSW